MKSTLKIGNPKNLKFADVKFSISNFGENGGIGSTNNESKKRFDVEEGPKGLKAVNVKRIDDS